MEEPQPYSITILGSAGGVAKAILSILNQAIIDQHDPIYHILNNSKLYLIDQKQQKREYYNRLFPNLKDKINLLQFNLQDVNLFNKHLKKTNTKIVIDVSWADTIEMLECCNKLGVYYLNSALENTEVDEDESLYGFPLSERYVRFEEKKPSFTNTTAIIGSGMNPGVVQWMALKLMNDHPNEKPLACYIFEQDDSFFTDKQLIKPKTIYTSWSVECFLDEAILSYPMFVRHHLPLYLYEDVYATEYKVTIGSKEFYGCLMPHEEVLSLGEKFDMEMGFIYRVNEYTTDQIRNNLDDTDKLWDWNQQVIDPSVGEVKGEDLVGVLLVYKDHEKYIYNTMKSSDIFPKFKTNATYFQVACGLYGGLASLLLDDIPKGIYYVDDLLIDTKSKYGNYLSHYMKEIIYGENEQSGGFLHQRRKSIQ